MAVACSSRNSEAPGQAGDAGGDVSTQDGTTEAMDSGSSPGSGDSDAALSDALSSEAGDGALADALTDAGDCPPGFYGEPTELRCTGLYSDWASKSVSPDVHEYDPGLHLWSDGAVKTRWIFLPPNGDGGRQPIDTSNMDEWTFPPGTKLWKEFVLQGKRIETRLLWKQLNGSWYLTTYRWSPDQASATELTAGELDADGNGYEVPSQLACGKCHFGRQDIVLGFEAVSLSTAGATPVTMKTLAASGWITHVPDAGIVIPGNATDVAALGYLHTNCGVSCHDAVGLANGSGFFMRLNVGSMSNVQATDTWKTGVDKLSFFAPPGGGNRLLRLAPGDAGASCVHYRMSRRDVDDAGVAIQGVQMPPIDSHKVDEAGVSVIDQWIAQGCQ